MHYNCAKFHRLNVFGFEVSREGGQKMMLLLGFNVSEHTLNFKGEAIKEIKK